MFSSFNCNAQLTINIRYSSENGGARKYVEEMESSGIAARIRAVEGASAMTTSSRQTIRTACS